MHLRFAYSVTAIGAAALLVTGCSSQVKETPSPGASTSSSASEEWSYTGTSGPDHWGDSNPACAVSPSNEQSPINIDNAALAHSTSTAPVQLALTPAEFGVFNNGHTIEAAPETAGAAGNFSIGEETYTVAQFHFHDPSEHTIDGKHSEMEMHVVGKTSAGKIAVLGVLLEVGTANEPLSELFTSMPSKVTEESDAIKLQEEIDLNAIVPQGSEMARYEGSLTTPPCTEGVVWDVYLTPAKVSQQQLDAFKELYADNARPVQTLNGREVIDLAGNVS